MKPVDFLSGPWPRLIGGLMSSLTAALRGCGPWTCIGFLLLVAFTLPIALKGGDAVADGLADLVRCGNAYLLSRVAQLAPINKPRGGTTHLTPTKKPGPKAKKSRPA